MARWNMYERWAPHHYPECYINYWLWAIVPVLLVIIGTSGNILNIIILTRKQIKKYSTSVYLRFLAGTDIVFLWTGPFTEFIMETTGIRTEEASDFNCKTQRWIIYSTGGYSVWLLVALTLERLFMTRSPILARTKTSTKQATITSVVLLVLCLIFSSHYLFGRHLVLRKYYDNETKLFREEYRCENSSPEFSLFYKDLWNLLILVVLNVILVLIIIIGNIHIIISLIIQKRQLFRRVNPTLQNASIPMSRRKSSTKMLFVITGFFMVTTLPFTMIEVFHSYDGNTDPRYKARIEALKSVLALLLYSNFTFNFFLYFVSGTMFKQEWKKLLISCNNWFGNLRNNTIHVIEMTANQNSNREQAKPDTAYTASELV